MSRGLRRSCYNLFAMMQELYKEIILDHFRRPRHRHEIEDAEIKEHLNNPLCGDEVTVYANLRDDGLDVSFTGRGCAISQASASMLAERLEGKSREEAEEEISAFLEMMRTEPNEDLGEEVKAVVQVVDGVEPGPALEQELQAFCRANLAHFKCPRSIDFEDELPRLPTGKLYKRLLRDRYWGNTTSRIV